MRLARAIARDRPFLRWPWFESRMTYANAVLPHSLFAAAELWPEGPFLSVAEATFAFLVVDATNERLLLSCRQPQFGMRGARRNPPPTSSRSRPRRWPRRGSRHPPLFSPPHPHGMHRRMTPIASRRHSCELLRRHEGNPILTADGISNWRIDPKPTFPSSPGELRRRGLGSGGRPHHVGGRSQRVDHLLHVVLPDRAACVTGFDGRLQDVGPARGL